MEHDPPLCDRLRLDYALEQEPGLLEQLLEDPQRVLERVGVDDRALVCPDDAHRSLARGDEAAAKANSIGDIGIVESLPQLREVVRDALGPDFLTAKVPFGIRFAERVGGFAGRDVTGTASVECTFGLECKGDVDG
jgi:hypothetical protein